MKKHIMSFCLALLIVFASFTNQAQNYNKIMGKAVKRAIGSDLKGYKVFSYPTNNFGLITSYQNSMDDTNFICDMWNCIGVDNPPVDSKDWMSLNNFAGYGGGGTINLSQSKKSKLAIKVVLPKIYDVVGITSGFDKDKTTQIDISIGKAYLRKLRRNEIIEYINKLGNDHSLKKAYNNGNLVLVVADCVIEDLSVVVKVDDATSLDLDAKIGVAGNSVGEKVFKDASLSVKVEKINKGQYSFKVSHPVIFARLPKQQPGAGQLGADEEFKDWLEATGTSDPSKLRKAAIQ